MSATGSTTDPHPGGESLAGRYLSLTLGSEACAVPLQKVREIIRLPACPPMAPQPDTVQGVINLHGQRIPVLDLRSSFGRRAPGAGNRTCVVVIQLATSQNDPGLVGLVVDAVSEVIEIEASQIAPLSEVGSRLDSSCLMGKAKIHGMLKSLLDVERAVALRVSGPHRNGHDNGGKP